MLELAAKMPWQAERVESAGVPAAPLCGQAEASLEWWYYNGHLRSGTDSFAFALAFFRASPFRRELSLPLRWLLGLQFAGGIFLSHFSLLDCRAGRFHYSHRRHARGAAGAASDRFDVWCGNWSAGADGRSHQLRASTRHAQLHLRLTPRKPLVEHGAGGWTGKVGGQQGYHCSLPRLEAEGMINLPGGGCSVRGEAWMDREFGTWELKPGFQGWDWCSVQLNNGCELMVYFFRDAAGQPAPSSYVSLVNQVGHVEHLPLGQFSWTAQRLWKSPWTGVAYPQGWKLEIATLGLELEIVPLCRHQELDTRGSMMVVYWEGAATVRGRADDRSVEGNAYVELFGYDRSHRSLSVRKWMGGGGTRPWQAKEGVLVETAGAGC